jgi:hypothetical protein
LLLVQRIEALVGAFQAPAQHPQAARQPADGLFALLELAGERCALAAGLAYTLLEGGDTFTQLRQLMFLVSHIGSRCRRGGQ